MFPRPRPYLPEIVARAVANRGARGVRARRRSPCTTPVLAGGARDHAEVVARIAAVREADERAVAEQEMLAPAAAIREVFPAAVAAQEVLARAEAVQEVLARAVPVREVVARVAAMREVLARRN